MTENESFATLIERLRDDDNGAARCLLDRYEPVLRRIISTRLMDRRLRRLVDADDICQAGVGME